MSKVDDILEEAQALIDIDKTKQRLQSGELRPEDIEETPTTTLGTALMDILAYSISPEALAGGFAGGAIPALTRGAGLGAAALKGAQWADPLFGLPTALGKKIFGKGVEKGVERGIRPAGTISGARTPREPEELSTSLKGMLTSEQALGRIGQRQAARPSTEIKGLLGEAPLRARFGARPSGTLREERTFEMPASPLIREAQSSTLPQALIRQESLATNIHEPGLLLNTRNLIERLMTPPKGLLSKPTAKTLREGGLFAKGERSAEELPAAIEKMGAREDIFKAVEALIKSGPKKAKLPKFKGEPVSAYRMPGGKIIKGGPKEPHASLLSEKSLQIMAKKKLLETGFSDPSGKVFVTIEDIQKAGGDIKAALAEKLGGLK